MSFASPGFLWYFLPGVLLATWVLPNRLRNVVICVASVMFYAIGGGAFTVVLLACIELNYVAGILLAQLSDDRLRRFVVAAAVAIDLSVLAVWKYAGFATTQLAALGRVLGTGSLPVLHLALPIGISFYTFHQISYVVDVYTGRREAQRELVAFVTYVAMFPQLIAGPIVRYWEIADQLGARTTSRLDDLADGFPRFCLGLAKKVVVADSIAPIVNAGFGTPTGVLDTRTAWLAVLAYTLQIYFDFSGYSDMAIGLGRMLGFQLPENFNRPYSATSITDFWRRWHMSLSRWFRDYLYIPLGGNRRGRVRTYLNLATVFLLVGLWHGANWTFVVWGAYHGGLLVLERIVGLEEPRGALEAAARRTGTLLLVAVGWVFFRSPNLTYAAHMLHSMFWASAGGLTTSVSAVGTNLRTLTLVLAVTVFLLPRRFVMGRALQFGSGPFVAAARLGYSSVAAGAAAVLLAAGTFSPFLYYQF